MEIDFNLENTNVQPPPIVLETSTNGIQASTSQGVRFATSFTFVFRPRTENSAPIPASRAPSSFRDIAVKVHIRRPGKDSWVYLGRALVTHEVSAQSSRVGQWCSISIGLSLSEACGTVVRSTTNDKIMTTFHEVDLFVLSVSCFAEFEQSCDLQAEKRGNFVVIGCIENARVVSWSLNVGRLLCASGRPR
jgi:hypothetical protein